MKFKISIYFLLFFICQSLLADNRQQQSDKEKLRQFLENDVELNRLYSNTYYTLINRMQEDGYLPESLTGAYKGMYPRTVGAYALLMVETGQYKQAEAVLKYVLDAMVENEELFVPHVISKDGGVRYIMDDQYQSDAHSHIILGWAKLALAANSSQFQKDTWPLVKKLMNRIAGRSLFLYGGWSIEPGLVRAVTFEHSRDFRMWDAYDLLTQSFVGAALHSMTELAEKNGEVNQANQWKEKERILSDGIKKHLVVKRDGKDTYAEMFIPNGDGGSPYMGMGWVCFSPVAAGWEGVDHQVLQNTMTYMEQNYLQTSGAIKWMPTDIWADGTFVDEVIGKGIGWELDFARSEENYTRINQILELMKASNVGKSVYMEFAWLEGNGFTRNSRVTKKEVDSKMQNSKWVSRDAGNGEQNTWFCWAMARLRKSVGLPAEPIPMIDNGAISVSDRNGLGKRITTIHSSSGSANGDENTFKLLLGNNAIYNFTDKWSSRDIENPWVIFSLTNYYNISKIEFRDGLSVENLDGISNCSSYKVFASNKGIADEDWVEIISEDNVKGLNVKSKTLDIPVEARYIKFMPKSGDESGKKIWIYGVDIYGNHSRPIERENVISIGKSIVSYSDCNSIQDTPANLLDGLLDNGAWVFNKSQRSKNAWVIIDLEKEYYVDGFSLKDDGGISAYNVYASNTKLDANDNNWEFLATDNFAKESKLKKMALNNTKRARYIKLEIQKENQSDTNRIYEFGILGTRTY